MTTSRSDAERRHAPKRRQNGRRAHPGTCRYYPCGKRTDRALRASQAQKSPPVDGNAPTEEARKVNSVHMAELNSVHITRPESARGGLSY